VRKLPAEEVKAHHAKMITLLELDWLGGRLGEQTDHPHENIPKGRQILDVLLSTWTLQRRRARGP
jgi:hypothetical protein